MRITVAKVKALNPCQSRFDNFVQQNPNFKGSVEDFLSLENITYSDKTWGCVRLMTKNKRFFWARSCAYSVLEIFETQRPNNRNVRDLLDYLGTLDDIENLTAGQFSEIRRLRDAADAAAAYAARKEQEDFNLIILAAIMQMDI